MHEWISSRRLRWALHGLLIGAGVALLQTLGLNAPIISWEEDPKP